MICAAKGCDKPVTYEKPLCYPHWLEFDSFEIEECEKCHYFSFEPSVTGDEPPFLCFDCSRGKDVPVHDHAAIEVELRYIYILQVDRGGFYVGTTYDLEARLVEHQQGSAAKTTRGQTPELVWFQPRRGDKRGLLDEEDELTLMTKSPSGRRKILQMVLDWQRPLQNIKFLNRPKTDSG